MVEDNSVNFQTSGTQSDLFFFQFFLYKQLKIQMQKMAKKGPSFKYFGCLKKGLYCMNTLFFFNKDQQKIFEAGMSLAYPQIKAQMFLKRP